MTNRPFLAILLGLLLIIGILVGWYQVTSLGEQVKDLSSLAEGLNERLVDAEGRVDQAEERATRAEADADDALRQAGESSLREKLSSEQAAAAEMARREAEERERRAGEAKRQAELIADEAAAAKAEAREKQAAAERREAESILAADKAWEETALAKAETARLERRMQRELDRMQHALGQIAQTRREGLELVMTLDSSQVEFDFNKAELRAENREVLSRIVGVLMTFSDYGIQIFGHTDDVGSADYNQQLSEKRALVVKNYLVDSGIDEDVIHFLGMGQSSPLIEGTDEEARQRNRRVEIGIVFSEGEYETLIEDPESPQ